MDGAGGYSGSGDDGTGTRTQNPGGNKRLQQTQAKVDEVVEIMQINVQNLMQRGERLEVMGERADALQQGAAQFEQQAGKLKRKYWWKNLKMMIIMAVIALIIIVIIIIWASSGVGGDSSSSQPVEPAKDATSPPQTGT